MTLTHARTGVYVIHLNKLRPFSIENGVVYENWPNRISHHTFILDYLGRSNIF